MKLRSTFAAIALIVSAAFFGIVTPQAYAGPACRGSKCNGLDPTGRCDKDATTVGAMHVDQGMLELRYSSSCEANWGRFTPYFTEFFGLAVYPRLTIWNPDQESIGAAHRGQSALESTWTYMVDGTKTACIGVELVGVEKSGSTLEHETGSMKAEDYKPKWNSSQKSKGTWYWGPCR